MTTTARLYFEAHITVEEPPKATFEDFAREARLYGFRASRFSEDEVDDYNGKWFLSFRGLDLDATKEAIRNRCHNLNLNGYTVLRWKIEDTVMDSKHGDIL